MNERNLPAVQTLRETLPKMRGEFAKALPGHITADKFVRTVQTAIAMTRNIEKVKDPQSFFASCTKAAQDGLILDGKEAALVIDYNGEVQYRPMMRGLLKLAYNSGHIKGIVVEVVRENDFFEHSPTDLVQPIQHKIDHKVKRGEACIVYALAEMKDGGIAHEVMSVEDVNRIRDRSDAYKAFRNGKIKSTPWSTDWSEMARKTVFRRLSKYLPASADRDDRLHQASERIDEDYSLDIDNDTGEPVAPTPAPKKRGGGAAALKDVTPAKKAEPDPAPAEPPHDPETGEVIDDAEYADYDRGPEDDI